ncbi:hypothetical protein [Reticulibacter mediterranei]|uniref:hypothetical protein n=1 Tax=Reticulibacter mediterranei TaxID=2778369 RepID=UPI001C68B463|nr:hypothetical protein [Reticulibacter mediterranei]
MQSSFLSLLSNPSFIIGLAMLMASYHQAGWNRWIFFLIGFVVAGFLILLLFFSHSPS